MTGTLLVASIITIAYLMHRLEWSTKIRVGVFLVVTALCLTATPLHANAMLPPIGGTSVTCHTVSRGYNVYEGAHWSTVATVEVHMHTCGIGRVLTPIRSSDLSIEAHVTSLGAMQQYTVYESQPYLAYETSTARIWKENIHLNMCVGFGWFNMCGKQEDFQVRAVAVNAAYYQPITMYCINAYCKSWVTFRTTS